MLPKHLWDKTQQWLYYESALTLDSLQIFWFQEQKLSFWKYSAYIKV